MKPLTFYSITYVTIIRMTKGVRYSKNQKPIYNKKAENLINKKYVTLLECKNLTGTSY